MRGFKTAVLQFKFLKRLWAFFYARFLRRFIVIGQRFLASNVKLRHFFISDEFERLKIFMTDAAISFVSANELPEKWQRVLAEEQLKNPLKNGNNEKMITFFEADLTSDLHFGASLLCLTASHLVFINEKNGVNAWLLSDQLQLLHEDYAGIGTFNLSDKSKANTAQKWRFTLGKNAAALRFLSAFNAHLKALNQDASEELSEIICPKCKAILPADEDECVLCAEKAQKEVSSWTLFRLWRFAHPYRGKLFIAFALMILSTAATLVAPYMTRPLMDNVLIPYQNGIPIDKHEVTLYLGILLGAALLAGVLSWGRTYLLARVSERIGADLRTTTYEHLLKLSHAYFGGKRTGDLMARIGSETDRINLFLSLHLLDFANDVLMILMTAIILVSINPPLAAITLLPLPLIIWMIHAVREHLRNGFEKVDRIWAEVTNVLADTIPGIRVVKAFAQEAREVLRFRETNNRNLKINDKVNRIWSVFSPTVTFLTEVGLLIVWAFGIWQIAKNEISVGVLVAFLAYIGRFYTRLDSMSRIVSVTQKAAAGARRIFDILDHVSSVPEAANPVFLKEVKGEIELRDIGFRYGTRAVTKGISLKIKAGEMIGLVGHSGSGKSTLVNLICRFYDVSEGAILLDGVDIRALKIADYRQNIGLVLQEPFLFFGTIAENIAYGKPEATREEIVRAARAANAHEFILRLPHAYDSLVGERGQSLSGGERQRISIARALLINPRVLILDEATSSVDTSTEKEIQKALDNLVAGRTTIAIAHRLSTLREANRLVVLDKGNIVEVGSHAELMREEGHYFRLYMAQARQEEEEKQNAFALTHKEKNDDQ